MPKADKTKPKTGFFLRWVAPHPRGVSSQGCWVGLDFGVLAYPPPRGGRAAGGCSLGWRAGLEVGWRRLEGVFPEGLGLPVRNW